VIGISAVDGRGSPFKGGGRVVKNVAGYDFCKLLTGSLGTLAVITQVTLKLKPIPEQQSLVACAVRDSDEAERVLSALVQSETSPTAVELLAGPVWQQHPALATLGRQSAASKYLVVGLEGTATEVEWMTSRLTSEWRELGVEAALTVGDSADLWRLLVEFPAEEESPLVLKASLAPSGVTPFLAAARELDPHCSVQAHAGNGIVIVKFASFPEKGLSRALVGGLQPVASKYHGNIVILSNPSGNEMTHQSAWGGIDAPFALMTAVKRQFDPKNVLNRGRFVYI
jgi:glycolate oxidase FAD binding subunit